MKIIVLGGDGFCGWASSLRLSSKGHEVFIFDNLSRRKIDKELKASSLTPVKSIYQRLKTWNKINKNKIKFYKIDVSKEILRLEKLIKKINPDTIIHFAEQRSAPYSMINLKTRNYTLSNNILTYYDNWHHQEIIKTIYNDLLWHSTDFRKYACRKGGNVCQIEKQKYRI